MKRVFQNPFRGGHVYRNAFPEKTISPIPGGISQEEIPPGIGHSWCHDGAPIDMATPKGVDSLREFSSVSGKVPGRNQCAISCYIHETAPKVFTHVVPFPPGPSVRGADGTL